MERYQYGNEICPPKASAAAQQMLENRAGFGQDETSEEMDNNAWIIARLAMTGLPGRPYRGRTYDQWIKSPLLYQLS